MTNIELRTFRANFLARLIGRFRAWMDESIVLDASTPSHFAEGDRADLPVHHPVFSSSPSQPVTTSEGV